jgi:hypothetical protein
MHVLQLLPVHAPQSCRKHQQLAKYLHECPHKYPVQSHTLSTPRLLALCLPLLKPAAVVLCADSSQREHQMPLEVQYMLCACSAAGVVTAAAAMLPMRQQQMPLELLYVQ